MEETETQPRKGRKATYRALTIPERDLLYALYEKHHSNMTALFLDEECLFKSYATIRYYAKLYHFYDRYIANRQKKADEVLSKLSDAKLQAIENAMRMLKPHFDFVHTKTGIQLFDHEGKPIIIERHPYYKEVKAAWEIIKTELGEPTTISKAEVHNPEDAKIATALDALAKLTEHEKPQDNRGAVQGERKAAGDTAEVPAALHDNPDPQPSAQ